MKIENDAHQLKYLLSVFNTPRVLIGDAIITKHAIENQIKKLQEKVEFINQIKAHEDQILGKFNLSKYFVLNCWLYEDTGDFNVSLELSDDISSFIYNNFIHSHSGIREWVEVHFCHIYDFLSGNSQYNFAFGTMSFKRILEDVSKMNDVSKIISSLNSIKEYFAAEENKYIIVALDAIIDSAQEMML